jgi:hypothetical protein
MSALTLGLGFIARTLPARAGARLGQARQSVIVIDRAARVAQSGEGRHDARGSAQGDAARGPSVREVDPRRAGSGLEGPL